MRHQLPLPFRPAPAQPATRPRRTAPRTAGLYLLVALSTPLGAAAATICNRYCDARDPALSTMDRQPVINTVHGRDVVLHFNDNDAMGWASIAKGGAGDQIWLDRSFDNGRTWSTGSRLGDTTVASGETGRRTTMFNVDDWGTRGIGMLRACGKASGFPEISCTSWARSTWNAGERRTAAVTTLMGFYNQATGLFDTTGWWNSANALTAVIDNVRVTGMGSYRYAIGNTYDRNVNTGLGQFRTERLDHTGWWAMAWIAAYDLTKEQRYLDTAKAGAEHMAKSWDTSVCNGGVYTSSAQKTEKNAITNSLYIELNAALHNRIAGDSTYLKRAQDGWAWFDKTGMVNRDTSLVSDGTSLATCRTNNGSVWTHNQGALIGALNELHIATGDKALRKKATKIADAATTTPLLNADGITREPCESTSCGVDGPSYKGAFVRGLAKLNGAIKKHPYDEYLKKQANTAFNVDRNPQDAYGLKWAGPIDAIDAARQHSAVDVQNAAPYVEKQILFVGNSFTHGDREPTYHYNAAVVKDLNGSGLGGMPGIFKQLTLDAGLRYDVHIEAISTWTLQLHYDNKRSLMGSKTWDAAVLQEYSTLDPVSPGNPASLIHYSQLLEQYLHGAGNPNGKASTKVYLLETWPRADQVYLDTGFWFNQGLEGMWQDLHSAYKQASDNDPAIEGVLPVGDAFLLAVTSGRADRNPYDGIDPGKENVWNVDSYHASTFGSYLEALVAFGTITGVDPRTLGSGNEAARSLGLTPSQATTAQDIAYQQVWLGEPHLKH